MDDRQPVLVGWAAETQREADPAIALEASALMAKAAKAAGRRSGAADLLTRVERIYVPKGRWSYRNPGRSLAQAIGAPGATTLLSSVGVLQQTLIGDACSRIRDGEIGSALVAGGDTGYRILQSLIAGTTMTETQQEDDPDILLAPHDELRHPAELRAGLQMPVGLYAILHSAFAAERGDHIDSYRDRIAQLFSELSGVAAENPDAWKREAVPARTIREPSARNPMQAFPYTKLHCSSWNVDQAAALLLCSAGLARELGIPPERWIVPVASAESNHMLQVSTRPALDRCPGARIACDAALAAAGATMADVSRLDLYSCFPAAVEIYAAELGVEGRRPLTVTGGMPFAGGPYNNYVFQATARMADLLAGDQRVGGPAATGLVASVSGVLTKQGFGLWTTAGGRADFVSADVSDTVAACNRPLHIDMDYSGEGRIAGSTVLHGGDRPRSGVAVIDIPGGMRAVARTEDEETVAAMEASLVVGRTVRVDRGSAFTLI